MTDFYMIKLGLSEHLELYLALDKLSPKLLWCVFNRFLTNFRSMMSAHSSVGTQEALIKSCSGQGGILPSSLMPTTPLVTTSKSAKSNGMSPCFFAFLKG